MLKNILGLELIFHWSLERSTSDKQKKYLSTLCDEFQECEQNIRKKFTLTRCNDPDTCLSTKATGICWEDQSSLFLFVQKAVDALKSSDEILHRNLYFIEKGIHFVLLCPLG